MQVSEELPVLCHRLFIMKKTRKGRVLKIALSVLGVLILLGVIFCLAFYFSVRRQIDFDKDAELFEMAKGSKTTRFYYDTALGADADGIYRAKELEDERVYYSENSIWVTGSHVPENLKNAFIAIEDRRFYSHTGVDYLRTAKAALNYFLHFDSRFGGSTITQQLIKNISSDKDISIRRKLSEMIRAREIEKRYSKEEILELYLNIVPLSQGCVGVGSAANRYFGKDISELTLAECASIAAITNSPARYDIARHPEKNRERRNIILSKMLEYGYINEGEYNEAISAEITVKEQEKKENKVNSWYIDAVIEDVIDDLSEKKNISRQTASKLVYSGGLKIYTNMNFEVQSTLESYFNDLDNFPDSVKNDSLEYSMIVTNPYNGAVLGVVGGVGEKTENRVLNYATQSKRPIGSVIKPLSLYAPAIEENLITWGTVIDDTPTKFYDQGDYYTMWPQNSPNVYDGLTDIATAVRLSKNTVAIKVYDMLGAEKAYDYLTNRLGFSSIVRTGYDKNGRKVSDMSASPLAFGQLTFGATLRESVGAYDALLTGEHHKSRFYLAVYDNKGELLLHNKDEKTEVFSDQTATVVTKMLEGVVNSGTAKEITLKNHIDTAGKTGTTSNNYDKYFIGYTPYMCAGIWSGYPESGRAVLGSSHLKIWDEVMTLLHRKYIKSTEEPKGFQIASGVEIRRYCADSGGICTELCEHDPRGERERVGYYKAGTAPAEECRTHVSVLYDTVNGGVATEFTPDESIGEVSLIRVENREFPTQIFITDAQYVYRSIAEAEPCKEQTKPFFYNAIPNGVFVGISKTSDGIQFNRMAQYGELVPSRKSEEDVTE